MKLSYEAVQVIRADLKNRIKTDSIQCVVDGGDLDLGRVSRLEFLAAGSIKLDPEEIDALLCDGETAERIRAHVDNQVRAWTILWFNSPRGKRWLELAVENQLDDEIAIEESRSDTAARGDER